jgi:hypothetical protein
LISFREIKIIIEPKKSAANIRLIENCPYQMSSQIYNASNITSELAFDLSEELLFSGNIPSRLLIISGLLGLLVSIWCCVYASCFLRMNESVVLELRQGRL